MKHLIPLLLLLTMLTQGCSHEKRCADIIERANNLVDSFPDSAVTVLAEIGDTAYLGNDDNRAMYYLTLTKAQYKAYRPTTVDTLLRQSVAYYKKQGELFNLSEAYYYQAMPLYERGQQDQSIALLKEGEQIAKSLKDDNLLSKYYESLYKVNSDAKYFTRALEYARKFKDVSLRQKDSACLCRSYMEMAFAYSGMEELDSSEASARRGIALIEKVDSFYQSAYCSNYGNILSDLGRKEEAKHYLYKSLSLHVFPHTYAILADIYFSEGDEEGAYIAWEKALDTEDMQLKRFVLKNKAKFLYKHKEYKIAFELLEQSNCISDSISGTIENEKVAEIQIAFDKKIMKEKQEKEKMKLYLTITGCVFISLLTFVLLSLFFHRTKYRLTTIIKYKEDEIKEVKFNNIELIETNDEIKKHLQELKEDIEHLKNNNVILNDEKRQLWKQIQKVEDSFSESKQILRQELLCGKLISDRVDKGENIPSNIPEAERHFIFYKFFFEQEWCERQTGPYLGLTAHETTFLFLVGMEKSTSEIATIMGVQEGAIRTLKSRLNKKLRKD